MTQKNWRFISPLTTCAVLLFMLSFTIGQFIASKNVHAQGNTLPIEQVKHTITFTRNNGAPHQPQLKATPDREGASSYFYLSGTGFLAHESIAVSWRTSQKSILLGQATTDNTGGLYYAGFYTPKRLTPANYTIVLQRAKGVVPALLTLPFHILAPAMQVSHVPSNTSAWLLHLTNFAAYETLVISWDAPGSQLLGSTTAHYNGEGYFSFTATSTPKGVYVITVRGQESSLRVNGLVSYP